MKANECDFLIKKGVHIIKAIQVTYTLKKNKEREIGLLKQELEVRDERTKVLEERLNNLIKKLEPLLEQK